MWLVGSEARARGKASGMTRIARAVDGKCGAGGGRKMQVFSAYDAMSVNDDLLGRGKDSVY